MFTRDGILYRQVNQVCAEDYTHLMDSGLYAKLVKAGLLIPHSPAEISPEDKEKAFKVIRPDRVPFISYPYEWSFGQIKDAALATLSIQKRALKMGMSLKDASAYNIQFHNGKPVLIDTLSFERYQEGEPWVAYRQFCQHFLAPLSLISYVDIRLNQLLRDNIDGIPLDLTSRLLPKNTRWKLGIATHIHLHARAQKRYSEVSVKEARRDLRMNLQAMTALVESLRETILKLEWKPSGTEWADYYCDTNYTDHAMEHKETLVEEWVTKASPRMIWDLGANTGKFSQVAAKCGEYVIASDIDPAAVELNYRSIKEKNLSNILPLVVDLTNPSPAIGWHYQERDSFLQRGPADLVMALALVHHLAISNNTPLEQVAEFLASCGQWLIVEFVPKSDSQVQRLLRNRKDIFEKYTQEGFEEAFKTYFHIHSYSLVRDSDRRMYFMKRK